MKNPLSDIYEQVLLNEAENTLCKTLHKMKLAISKLNVLEYLFNLDK